MKDTGYIFAGHTIMENNGEFLYVSSKHRTKQVADKINNKWNKSEGSDGKIYRIGKWYCILLKLHPKYYPPKSK